MPLKSKGNTSNNSHYLCGNCFSIVVYRNAAELGIGQQESQMVTNTYHEDLQKQHSRLVTKW